MRALIKKRLSLAITLVLFVFCVMFLTFLIMGGAVLLLQHTGLISWDGQYKFGVHKTPPYRFLLVLVILCILLGSALTGFLGKIALNPIKKVIAATHRVAGGDFSTKVNVKGICELEELSHSFNKMTQELSSLETLRSDFVNNFSHEFKTPIVSIRGFAKLLKSNHLTEEERREYLDIIILESERLAQLSTNVLNLSKYENTDIIPDKALYCLDEQIRRTILLVEPKWSAEGITVNVELDEVYYNGNEDLMQQLWLNLIDNAIKFSYPGGCINVTLKADPGTLRFVIEDEGPGMDEQTKAHIFDKFYQGDASHSKSGNGLGLTLVQRIVTLCGGNITVTSTPGKGSVFMVCLPNSPAASGDSTVLSPMREGGKYKL